ncbi:MAG TPA: SMP-30/gluconolactonase/LRE family protein [Beijerinckiaceae bacterium]|nr:SMP-30/gluconolactonase/LRE family protein [Beijerinckiaceae bacterium]
MKRSWTPVLSALAVTMLGGISSAQTAGDKPTVSKLDPSLDSLISSDAKLQTAATGFGFTEGTAWSQKGNYLLFSDIPANVIYKLPPGGKASVFMEHSGYQGYDIWRVGRMQPNGPDPSAPGYVQFALLGSNGLTVDPQGRVVICASGDRALERIEKNGKRTILADKYEGKRFNGPNDVIVKKDGTIYFTDGFDGLRGADKDPEKGLDFRGIFMLKDGKVTRIADDIPNPNGLSLSPDEKTFYANGSAAKFVRAYDVQPDDSVTNSRMLIDMSDDKTPGITDGMKVDTKGNIWESGPGGVWIISPQGKHLGTIFTPKLVGNLEFGDADHKTLYMAARSDIYKVRVNVAGIP